MQTPNVNFPAVKMQGIYQLRKRNADTGEVVQELAPFKNKITDIGLNRMGTGAAAIHAYVGTGTTPSEFTDTNMGTYLVTSNSRTAVYTAPVAPYWYAQTSFTYVFNAGAISNNITEVGIGWAPLPPAALWSRELIVDSLGNPVTLTVLPNEILEVIYTLRYYIDVNDFTGSFVLNGETYNYTGRPRSIGAARVNAADYPIYGPIVDQTVGSNAALAAITDKAASGTILTSGTHTQETYVSNSLERKATSSWGLTQGNGSGGIKGFGLSLSYSTSSFLFSNYQLVLDKAIPKTNLISFSLTWKVSWGRYTGPIL